MTYSKSSEYFTSIRWKTLVEAVGKRDEGSIKRNQKILFTTSTMYKMRTDIQTDGKFSSTSGSHPLFSNKGWSRIHDPECKIASFPSLFRVISFTMYYKVMRVRSINFCYPFSIWENTYPPWLLESTMRRNLLNWCKLVPINKKLMFYVHVWGNKNLLIFT